MEQSYCLTEGQLESQKKQRNRMKNVKCFYNKKTNDPFKEILTGHFIKEGIGITNKDGENAEHYRLLGKMQSKIMRYYYSHIIMAKIKADTK